MSEIHFDLKNGWHYRNHSGDMQGCPPPFANSIHAVKYALERLRDKKDAVGLIWADAAGALEWAIENDRTHVLEKAVSRQVDNIEYWLDTGVAASPDESKSIYDQMKAALKSAA